MSATASPTRTASTSSLRRRALGVAAAVLACVSIWVVGEIAGVDFTVESPGQPVRVIGLGAVVPISLASALLGWVALTVLERFAGRRATALWIALAVVVAVISFFPLFGVEATAGAKVALGAMHLAVAVVLIALLPARRS